VFFSNPVRTSGEGTRSFEEVEDTPMTRSWLGVLLILSCSVTAAAQPPDNSAAGQPAPTFQDLRNFVRPGETLRVFDAQGNDTKGRLMNIRDDAITLAVDGMRRDFSADAVAQIERTRRDPVKDGVLKGLAAGAVVGYALGRRADSPACYRRDIECGQAAVIGAYGGAFWGAIFGWIVDATHRTRETIFAR
jgi:hypothetical protein